MRTTYRTILSPRRDGTAGVPSGSDPFRTSFRGSARDTRKHYARTARWYGRKWASMRGGLSELHAVLTIP